MENNEEQLQEAPIANEESAAFVKALEFVDQEIDSVDQISDLGVEAFVALAILQVARYPDQVRVSITKAQRLVIMEIDVHDADVAQVIGKRGHTIEAIRSLAASSSGREDGVEYWIYLLKDGKPAKRLGGPRQPRRSFRGRNGRNDF